MILILFLSTFYIYCIKTKTEAFLPQPAYVQFGHFVTIISQYHSGQIPDKP